MTIPSHLSTLIIPPSTPALARLADVRDGLLGGESFRSLGRKLKCDEKTVRRDYDKLCLPTDKLQAILEGADCEPVLREHARELEEQERARVAAERANKRALELVEERRSGLVSDELKNSIVAFLAQFCLLPQDNAPILRAVEKESWHRGFLSEDCRAGDHSTAIALTNPGNALLDPNVQVSIPSWKLSNYVAAWLYRWLLLAEPNRDIRDAAIVKARRYYEPHCSMP
jgi:hypothetical protein